MDPQLKAARRRARAKRAFYTHFTTYLVMAAFFLILNILTSPGILWFYWPLLGWGIGLAIHYFATFGPPGTEPFNEEWEDRQVEKELRRIQGRRSAPPPPPRENLELRDLKREAKKEPAVRRTGWEEDDLV